MALQFAYGCVFVLHFLFASVRVCALRTVVLDSDSARPGLHVRLSPRTIPFFSQQKLPLIDLRDVRQFSVLCFGAENRVVRHAPMPRRVFQSFRLSVQLRARRDETRRGRRRVGCRRGRDLTTKPVALALCSSLRIFTREYFLGIINPSIPHTLFTERKPCRDTPC